MIASLTIALGMAAAGGPPYGHDGAIAPPPIPIHPVAGTTVAIDRPRGAPRPFAARGAVGHRGSEAGFILPPGPGNGWGFPNDAPDGFGWYDPGVSLPIREDRTTDYYFRRYMASPAQSMFLPSYYNPFVNRGQRFIPYVGCGGLHAAGGAPTGSAMTSATPYDDLTRLEPRTAVPDFSGEVQAEPVDSSRGQNLIKY